MLEQICVYPVKSLTGVVDLGEAEVEPWGLRHDRRWLLLNPDGTVLTAREQHELLAPMVMARFRPSVVVDHPDDAFAEDGWAHVRIGSVEFRLSEHCDRCVLTTIEPQTRVAGKEPLRTLAKHRQWDHKTWFGIRLVPVTTGLIRVGDPVMAA